MAEENSASAVDEAELKRKTGEFDLEAIFFLDLSDRGLRAVGAVPQCVSLSVLNLSCNQLEDVRGLSSLVVLEELDLSANLISSLQGFDKLESLQRLDLPGNNLAKLDTLLPLCTLPHLTTLSLTLHTSPTLTNPLCLSSEYHHFVGQRFPHLCWLDGERVEKGGVRVERVELERELERLGRIGKVEKVEEGEDLKSGAEPLTGFSTNDEQAMQKIQRLLSECSDTSQRVQDHIHALQKEILN